MSITDLEEDPLALTWSNGGKSVVSQVTLLMERTARFARLAAKDHSAKKINIGGLSSESD